MKASCFHARSSISELLIPKRRSISAWCRERGYSSRYWPALYPEEMDCYDGNLDPNIQSEVLSDPALVGEPTDPERFSHEDILQRQASMTKVVFCSSFSSILA